MSAVTGAFGYLGKYIARRLLRAGEEVITLTGHPGRENEFGGRVKAFPFRFDRPEAMAESLAGVRVLYNTYWVRFDRGAATHEGAVENSRALLRAAKMAGVERVVHTSITNPDRESQLPYFRGKALVEDAVRESGMSYAILRPTVLFGEEDILVHNIAYLLRRFPVFLMPGTGQYRLQPVFVEDAAQLAVDAGMTGGNVTLDAVGPEIFTFEQMVRVIARAVRSGAGVVPAPAGLALLAARALGALTGDVVLTRDEVEGLSAGLLVSESPPTCRTALSRWAMENAGSLGAVYHSEVKRHYAG
jgi:uncharacterized protein YbjT (DUF2867 family)